MTSPKLAITQPDGSRKYVHPVTGEMVPSVTTVIKAAFPKPALVGWAARMAAQYLVENWDALNEEGIGPSERIDRAKHAHEQYRDNAAAKGDSIHELIDAWAKGEACEVPKGADSSVNQFINWMMEEKPSFLYNEVTLWSRTHQYAGTADWIAEINGTVYLGDNKTGKRVYAETALQLAALAGTDFIITQDGEEKEIPALEELVALHVRPRSWKLVRVNERKECFAAFLSARNVLRWTEEVAPNVLGC